MLWTTALRFYSKKQENLTLLFALRQVIRTWVLATVVKVEMRLGIKEGFVCNLHEFNKGLSFLMFVRQALVQPLYRMGQVMFVLGSKESRTKSISKEWVKKSTLAIIINKTTFSLPNSNDNSYVAWCELTSTVVANKFDNFKSIWS